MPKAVGGPANQGMNELGTKNDNAYQGRGEITVFMLGRFPDTLESPLGCVMGFEWLSGALIMSSCKGESK
jgi:hypothetical protein